MYIPVVNAIRLCYHANDAIKQLDVFISENVSHCGDIQPNDKTNQSITPINFVSWDL